MSDAKTTEVTPKPAIKSEFLMVMITSIGAMLSALTATQPSIGKWVSLGVTVATVSVYALWRTPLLSERPGWKTKAFWAYLAVVVASVAAAIAEVDVPGIPHEITKSASIIVTMLAALGYTAIRVNEKKLANGAAKA